MLQSLEKKSFVGFFNSKPKTDFKKQYYNKLSNYIFIVKIKAYRKCNTEIAKNKLFLKSPE